MERNANQAVHNALIKEVEVNMPNITIREYHPESGALLGNVSVLDFGKITAGSHSRPKVIDVVFDGVSSVGNIKVGIVSNGSIIVNEDPTGVNSDGSSSNGHFGIESSSSFSGSKAASPLTRHFSGLNSEYSADSTYNVSVGNRSDTISNYIYLDIEIGSGNILAGNGAYKIFFDYS